VAQEWHPTEKAWTDKNNTEQYAAYLLSSAYAERGYYGAKVDIKQFGDKRLFVVDPGSIYHVREVIVSGPSEVQGSARSQDAPKPGDAYSAAKANEWIQMLRKQYEGANSEFTLVSWGAALDHDQALVTIRVAFRKR
jgi:outer membrane protein assembly factor BamA